MIYLLTRQEDIGYDENDAKVVCAESEREAREIANLHPGDEGACWTDEKRVTVEVIDPHGHARQILSSFNAG